jgi:hypothetical protein
VPSGYESPRAPLLKKMCFGDPAPNRAKQAREEDPQEVRLPKVSACSRQRRQQLKEDFPRIIVGH